MLNSCSTPEGALAQKVHKWHSCNKFQEIPYMDKDISVRCRWIKCRYILTELFGFQTQLVMTNARTVFLSHMMPHDISFLFPKFFCFEMRYINTNSGWVIYMHYIPKAAVSVWYVWWLLWRIRPPNGCESEHQRLLLRIRCKCTKPSDVFLFCWPPFQ